MHELFGALQELWQTVHHNGIHTLGPLSYLLIAILVATEGPITTLIGAASAAAGYLDIRLVFIATAIGNVVGDTLWYSLGYAGKSEHLHKLTGRVGIHKNQIDQIQDEMRCHAIKAILVAKITFGLIIPTLVAAGFARVPLKKWLPAVLVAETLWSILLVSLGFHAAGAIAQIENGFRLAGIAAALVAITSIAIYLTRKRRQLKQQVKSGDATGKPLVQPLSESVAAHESATSHRQPAYRHVDHRHLGHHHLGHSRPVTATPATRSAQVLEKV